MVCSKPVICLMVVLIPQPALVQTFTRETCEEERFVVVRAVRGIPVDVHVPLCVLTHPFGCPHVFKGDVVDDKMRLMQTKLNWMM